MKFGILSGNSVINTRIYEMFEYIHPIDSEKFARKLKSESDSQRFHTYRELILGSELCRRGLNLRYEQKVGGKTPDWVVVSADETIEDILDVVTLHQRRATDIEIGQPIASGRIWSGWVTVPPDHIYSKLQQKADVYANISSSMKLPYTICMFGEFTASVDPSEIEHVVYSHHGGLFLARPHLAGVLYFFENSGKYHFSHFANKFASIKSRNIVNAGKLA